MTEMILPDLLEADDSHLMMKLVDNLRLDIGADVFDCTPAVKSDEPAG